MAAVTGAIVTAGAGLYEGYQQREAAEDASRRQAQGVREAQQENIQATNRARAALGGQGAVSDEQRALEDQLAMTMASNPREFRGLRRGDRSPQAQSQIQNLRSDIEQFDQARMSPDPRQELLSGIQGQMDFTSTGFRGAQETLNPLASMAQPYLQEQRALLGLGGQQEYQDALSRISDPLAAEQERALLRNNAALGGVGGNVLSQLAEQTRARTEANIGNRLGQLGAASSPALNALQNISNLRLNQGLSMADIMGGGGRDLATQETARRQALANIELGQGSELAQLAQNLGTAQAGGAAFAAQNPNPITQGIASGINMFSGLGGFGQRPQQQMAMNVANPNLYGNYS